MYYNTMLLARLIIYKILDEINYRSMPSMKLAILQTIIMI